MKLIVVVVGKLKERELRALVDDYVERVRRHSACEEIEVRDTKKLEKAIPTEAFVVALDSEGELLTSNGFAKRVDEWSSQNKGIIAFVLGGAEGLPDAVLKRSDFRLSLGRMTLPHRLARLVLAEQLYRVMTILRGEPYPR